MLVASSTTANVISHDDFDDEEHKSIPGDQKTKNKQIKRNNIQNKSTSTSLNGGDSKSEWNKIGNINELNDKVNQISALRENTKSKKLKNVDGGFKKQDNVLFFSKIDNQYIPGVIKQKKKDKLTKDYVYKIKKIHKRDPDVDEELNAKKRSATEDPRVDIIKLREKKATKQATITCNVENMDESYYKIMSINDYQIELQVALLKLLKSKVKKVIKNRNKLQKLNNKATNIDNKMKKSKLKRDRTQRKYQTFSGSRQQMIALSNKSLNTSLSSKIRSKSKPNKKKTRSPKHGKYIISVSGSDLSGGDDDYDGNNEYKQIVNKPSGDPTKWKEGKVLIWLQWISQNKSVYENDRRLSDEERKNFKKARMRLFDNYAKKFVNANINGMALSKLNKVSLRSKVYMNNAIERKLMVKCLDELFGKRKKLIKAINYEGTEYDFSRDWRKSNRSEILFQKRKAVAVAAGNLNKPRMGVIGTNINYKGTEWTKNIEDMVSGDIYKEKVSKHSKTSSFLQRKRNIGDLKNPSVSDIGITENYIIPEYAEKAIADTMIGQATDPKLRWGGDLEGDNKELIKILLHSNITIPPELTRPIKGYHTIQKRNGQLRNLLLKHQAIMDEEDITNNRELQRVKALKKVRKQFKQKQEKKEIDALKSGDIEQITKTYGRKHKKLKQIKEIMKLTEKEEKRLKIGKKYNQRYKQNKSSLALIKRRKTKLKCSSIALTDIGNKYKKSSSSHSSHSRKRSSSIDVAKLSVNVNGKQKQKQKQIRPLSAGGGIGGKKINKRSQTMVGFKATSKSNKKNQLKRIKEKKFRSSSKSNKNKKKNGDNTSKKVKKEKIRISFTSIDDDKEESILNTKSPTDSNISNDSMILYNATTPKSDTLLLSPTQIRYDGSIESDDSKSDTLSTPKTDDDDDDDDDDYDDGDILKGIQRMESQDRKSVIVHNLNVEQNGHISNQSMGGNSTGSSSFATSWIEGGDDDNNYNEKTENDDIDIGDIDSSSSELTFSDNEDDNDDDDDDGVPTMPLSIQRLKAQEKQQENNKINGYTLSSQ